MTGSWIVEALIASTLLMVAVLALRASVRRVFGAQVAYALWALPVLRLLLPPLPASWREAAATPIGRAGETITVLMIPVDAVQATAAPLPVGFAVTVLWIAGATAFLGWHLLRHRVFCRRILAQAEPVADRDGVRVIASDAAPGPLAFGIWRRYVAFPRDFAHRYDADEQALALEHELGHHARGDLLANWIALGVLAIQWFNPVAWRAFHAFRADQELANDARVLAGRSRTDRHIYACAIVKAAHGGAISAACHLHTINDLKGRLKMLTVSRFSRRRLGLGAATVSLLALAGLGLTVSGSQAAAAISDRVGDVVGVDLQQPVLPMPPVPPVPPGPPAPIPGVDVTTSSTTQDGKTLRTRIIRRNGADGTMPSEAETDEIVRKALAAAPEVTERRCADGADGPAGNIIMNTTRGDRKVMVICTNRIEKMAEDAAASAQRGAELAANAPDIERRALESALSGLRAARIAIAGNQSMTADQRREALAGIDEGLTEVQADIAKAN